MAGALEDLAKTLDLQPADILSAFTGLRAAVPIYMGLGATGLNAGEDEQLRRIYGPLPPTPVPRETPEMAQRRMIDEFEQRFPTPELRRAVIEQMRQNRRVGQYDPETATRRIDFAPHTQPGYKGPVASPSIGKRKFQAGGKVVKKTAQQMADEMLLKGKPVKETVDLSRRGFFRLPESKSMPLAKIDDTTLDKLEKKYAKEGQAPTVTERTTTVSPDAGKTQSTLKSIVETPMSRRTLLQAAGSQAVQSMLPAGALPVPSVSNLAKPVMQAATATPSPLSMMGAIAKAVEAGLSERQAVAAVQKMFPKADRHEIEDSFQMLSDPYVNSMIEPGDLQRPIETMRNLIAPDLPSDASPFALRSAMREIKREAPLTYSGAKGFAKDIWDDEIETLFERGYIKSDDELRRLRMGDESIYDLMYDRGR